MALHHTKVKKYTGLLESGTTEEEIREMMVAEGLPVEDIDQFFSISKTAGESAGDVSAISGPPVFEEWKMSLSYDGEGNPILEKTKKIKDVKIDEDRAARLNEHAVNTRIKYFQKQ